MSDVQLRCRHYDELKSLEQEYKLRSVFGFTINAPFLQDHACCFHRSSRSRRGPETDREKDADRMKIVESSEAQAQGCHCCDCEAQHDAVLRWQPAEVCSPESSTRVMEREA